MKYKVSSFYMVVVFDQNRHLLWNLKLLALRRWHIAIRFAITIA